MINANANAPVILDESCELLNGGRGRPTTAERRALWVLCKERHSNAPFAQRACDCQPRKVLEGFALDACGANKADQQWSSAFGRSLSKLFFTYKRKLGRVKESLDGDRHKKTRFASHCIALRDVCLYFSYNIYCSTGRLSARCTGRVYFSCNMLCMRYS